jgi:hypothetical protein
MKQPLVWFALLLLLHVSCKKEELAPAADLGYAYYPTEIGHWVMYEVDSVYYIAGLRVEQKFQMKEVVQDHFDDLEGRASITAIRYRKKFDASTPYDQLPWDAGYLITATRTAQNLQLLEDNQTYLKLIFPPISGKKWNGNSFNAQDAWTFTYADVNKASSLASAFDSTLTVDQSGLNDPVINTQRGKEVYAKHVGLVYKTQTVLNVQGQDTSGTSFTMTLKDYGN